MADVQIRPCKCKSEFQDKTYGSMNRVYNPCFKGGFRCSVCGTTSGDAGKKK